MPVKVGKRNRRLRVIEVKTGRIARVTKKDGSLGKARDGGGQPNTPQGKRKIGRVARALNAQVPKGRKGKSGT